MKKASLDSLFEEALKKGASDVHLAVGHKPLLRISGDIVDAEGDVLAAGDVEALVDILLDAEAKKRFETEKEYDGAYALSSGESFRINLFFEKGNISMAARVIPPRIPTMDELMMPEIAKKMTEYPHGLVLVTGPTGSGKSTALAAMLSTVAERDAVNIITLEDPIEFVFPQGKAVIRQRQLGQDFVSFAEGLKHVLREDPDVVMVGEMRDPETIATALTIAETGHLVFATLHTYSAAQTVDRLIDSFPPEQQNQIKLQLALTLRGVISQQLIPQVGGGLIAAREVLINTPAVANLIREGKPEQVRNVIQTSAKDGMHTLAQDLSRLIKEGKVTKEIAQEYVVGIELDV
jgi:twitching motility protein PilT